MNQKALRVLEYDKIIALLADQASSDAGRTLCENLRPMTDPDQISRAQAETKDALERIFRRGGLSFRGLKNPGFQMKRLAVGGSLNIDELLMIAELLEVTRRAKTFARDSRGNSPRPAAGSHAAPQDDVRSSHNNTPAQTQTKHAASHALPASQVSQNNTAAQPAAPDPPADSLDKMFDALEPLTPLREEIIRCIPGPDEVSDEASPALRSIRRKIRGINDRIHEAMNSLLNSASVRTYLQDAVITMRGDRYCLPVKAEYKNQVPGMIHDQSSSGSTLFIEPMSVVRLNNDMKEAILKEKEEIEAVLASLSSLAAEHIPEITQNYRALTDLDFIFARAKLAKLQNAMQPSFNTEGRIRIRKGRHPLLDPKKVVPIDIRLGEEFHLLIVTGPNTGGKTVSLKTLGLLTLMGQSGLHIPAGDRCELAIFKQVYADIGDEQSIEQNLSTFSSHMTNIVSILKKANRGSLVLFDELCAGTDPVEGAALAISILEQLRRRGIRTMCTTHYSEMKLYAISTDGAENAGCEFDVETLSPTYRLLTGIPGKSNAFAISQKLGLPPKLIDDARARISQESENFEDVIAELEAGRRTIQQEQAQISRTKTEVEALKKQLEEKQEKLNQSRDRLLREASEQAAAILKEAKDIADETIRSFRKFGKENINTAGMEKEREMVRKKMEAAQQKAAIPNKPQENTNIPKNLRKGDTVKVLSMNMKGTVHTLPDAKGNLSVQMGILRYQVNIRDLVLVEEDNLAAARAPRTDAGRLKMSKSLSVSPEINLIGMTVAEAIPALDKYLDDAYLAHLKSVRIVHGKGTGALRNAVHSHLKRQSHIADYHLGEFGEGDAGVTIAAFN
ncbi:MAG: endonuclease MutS2 [Lachnospiraceae bacterium]|nr:endonuclease MutS2 [Lachnospiraceae bacterium]